MTELAATALAPATVSQPHDAQGRGSVLSENVSGVWTFILVECVTFSAYFVIFMLYRMHDPATFDSAQTHVSPTFGLVNTLILLTSSWQVARSLHSAREGRYGAAARQAGLTVALGAGFVVSKLSEWTFELRNGFSFETNDFFAFYFFLTGIHVVHVFVGFAFMSVAIHKLRGAEPSHEPIEAASVYWHMVDFLWVIIFALIYVVR